MNDKGKSLSINNAADQESFRVLVVDDEQLYAQAIARKLKQKEIVCDLAYSAHEAIECTQSNDYRVILLDHRLPDDDGIRIIPVLLARQPAASLIMMTAYESIPNAIQAIRQGAEDYLVKETSIKPILDAVLEIRQRNSLRTPGDNRGEHKRAGLLGRSEGILRVVEQILKVAPSLDTTVLFTGETGVGKEVAARYLHKISASPGSPLIVVDCVALPGNLVESLLFGHEKGAFTGADKTKKGAFQEATKGTIFFDEIGEMDIDLQGKLLRVLESRSFQRVGSVREHPVKARVVAATNRDLMELVKQGRFRFDLYQRLVIFPIHIPPLRERDNDVLLLTEHFVRFFSLKMNVLVKLLSLDVEERLLSYKFPGNVRELKNVIERAVIMTDSKRLELKHLPERILRNDSDWETKADQSFSCPVDFIPGIDNLETFEQKMISHALHESKGIKTKAAKMLGISRFQLLRRMEKYHMKPVKDKED